MPKLTAIVHTCNDAYHVSDLVNTLGCCDQVLIIDNSPDDSVENIARKLGASFRKHIPGVSPGAYSMDAQNEWILCVLPNESLGQELQASISSWKEGDPKREDVFAFAIRERMADDSANDRIEVRLINRCCINWTGTLPPSIEGAIVLGGFLLRNPGAQIGPHLREGS